MAQVPNIQVTPTGAAVGACTGSGVTILTPSQFGTSSNWGNSTGKIGNGTNILVCGTFTGTAGGTGLVFRGGGASGKPITLTCDIGSNFSAPYWAQYPGGAIVDNGYSYIVLNGANCTVQNTANGYGLSYNEVSTGIYINNATNVTVENFLIQNICVVSDSPSACGNVVSTWDHGIFVTNASDVIVQGNTIHDTNDAIQYNCSNGTDANNTITKNTISRANWGVAVTDDASTSGCSNMTVSYNDISDFANWDGGPEHHDPIIAYVQPPSGTPTMNNLSIYGNYIHGDMGGQATAMAMFIQENDSSGNATVPADGGTFSNLNIFNNVLINGRTVPTYGNGIIGTSGGHIFNNTIDCNQNNDGGIWINQDNGALIENNIIQNCQLGVYVVSGLTLANSNNNVLFNFTGGSYSECEVGSGPTCVMITGGVRCPTNVNCPTIGDWKTATGFDLASSTLTPNLSTSHIPQSSSSSIGLGTNLTGQGISALDIGAPQYFGAAWACGTGCLPRPASGAWDAGAYQVTSSGSSGQVSPPTGLSAIVN